MPELRAVTCGMRQHCLAIGHVTFAGLTWTCYDVKWLTGQHFSLSYSCVRAPTSQMIVKQHPTSVGPSLARSVCFIWVVRGQEKRWGWHIISQSAWPPQLHFHRLHHHHCHHSCICGHDWGRALCDLGLTAGSSKRNAAFVFPEYFCAVKNPRTTRGLCGESETKSKSTKTYPFLFNFRFPFAHREDIILFQGFAGSNSVTF